MLNVVGIYFGYKKKLIEDLGKDEEGWNHGRRR
jgi:hypothetical protein